jgi:hypothetical protein
LIQQTNKGAARTKRQRIIVTIVVVAFGIALSPIRQRRFRRNARRHGTRRQIVQIGIKQRL